MHKKCAAPWEDTGRKAKKLGRCLAFTMPSERRPILLLILINLSMIHLSSMCCKYLASQGTRCSRSALQANGRAVSACEVYICKSVDFTYQRSLSIITFISTHILCAFIMQEKAKCKLYYQKDRELKVFEKTLSSMYCILGISDKSQHCYVLAFYGL